jgi:hypothetical protein
VVTKNVGIGSQGLQASVGPGSEVHIHGGFGTVVKQQGKIPA